MPNERGRIIGRRVKAAREGKKPRMSQDDLARGAELTQSYISQLERGDIEDPGAIVMNKIAGTLGVEVSALLGSPPKPRLSSAHRKAV